MSSSPVRIDDSTREWLTEEAERRGTSVGAVISEAVQKMREAAFWESAQQAALALRSDPEAWAAEKHERQMWESLDLPIDHESPTRRRNR